MKFMWSVALGVVTLAAVASAQSSKAMNEHKMADTMPVTYTGCIEDVNHGASFLLTHVGENDTAMMHHDAMMKSESGTMNDGASRASNDMKGDHTMSSSVFLTGRKDLKKHLGQKVTVTGSVSHGMSETMPNDRETLAVHSLKVVAKSCR